MAFMEYRGILNYAWWTQMRHAGAIGVGAFENMHPLNKVCQYGGSMHDGFEDEGKKLSL